MTKTVLWQRRMCDLVGTYSKPRLFQSKGADPRKSGLGLKACVLVSTSVCHKAIQTYKSFFSSHLGNRPTFSEMAPPQTSPGLQLSWQPSPSEFSHSQSKACKEGRTRFAVEARLLACDVDSPEPAPPRASFQAYGGKVSIPATLL